jgi:hypothetical protein
MTRWIIVAGLVVLNGMLGIGVYQKMAERHAQAQIGGARLDIISIAGVSNGQTVIYLLDANSGKLIATRIDVANSQFGAPILRDVGSDLKRIP